MKRAISAVFRLFSSFGLTAILLLLMCLLTWLGTLEQVEYGLYQTQKKYFESFFLVHEVGLLKIPLPGVQLLLWVFGLNMLIGGIYRVVVRISKGAPIVGVLIGHVGIVLLVTAGAVKLYAADDGLMFLKKGDSKSTFVSANDWEIAAWRAPEDGESRVVQHIIDGGDFQELEPGSWRKFHQEGLPFEFYVEDVLPNSVPARAEKGDSGKVVDGVRLVEQPWQTGNERMSLRNIPGAYVMVKEPGGAEHRAILWGAAQYPWTQEIDGQVWQFELRERTWDLPFTIRLIDAEGTKYPGTEMAREYSSDVEWYEDGVATKAHISMNVPFRRAGYTLYQTGFDDSVYRDGAVRVSSTLSVVRNPSDKWPEISTWIIAIGLLIHFLMKLFKYLSAQARRRHT